jgi:hypothetical protein
MEKLPRTEDLAEWLEVIVSKDSIDSYDKTMIRLAVRLAEKGRKISSHDFLKVQAAVQIKELTKIITEPDDDE